MHKSTRHVADLALLEGYGTLTAQIIYRLPDHRSLLQEFIWQKYDHYPDFPELNRFFGFWVEEIEGPLHSVTVAHARLITPRELPLAGGKLLLN